MNSFTKKALLIPALFFISIFQYSYSQSIGLSIDSLMNFMHNKYFFDGVVLVAENDEPIYGKSFGLADRNKNIPNSMDTKFRLGSISKQFIGLIIIMLAEEGKISLDDPVSKYIFAFDTPDKKSIAIKNLLTHTSGIYNYTSMKEFDSKIRYTRDSLLKMMAVRQLNFTPGSNYAYSNSNFYICCAIAEKVTGKKFDEVLNEKILSQAEMVNTGIEKNSITPEPYATPYILYEGKFIEGEFIEMDNVAGGMYSNATDLLKWSLFVQKKLLSDKYLKETLVPFHLNDGTEKIYFAGWSLLPDEILHEGHINGFANHISIDTVNHRTIILLSNNDFRQLFATSRTISSLLKGNARALDWMNGKISYELLNEYTGDFTRVNDTVHNKNEKGTLVSYFGDQSFAWSSYLKDQFFSENFEGIIWFERDDNNKVSGLISYEDYIPVRWKKVKPGP